jgi:hypothetical protein
MMKAMSRGNAPFIALPSQQRGPDRQISSKVMNPFITEVMNPFIRGYSHRPDRPSL